MIAAAYRFAELAPDSHANVMKFARLPKRWCSFCKQKSEKLRMGRMSEVINILGIRVSKYCDAVRIQIGNNWWNTCVLTKKQTKQLAKLLERLSRTGQVEDAKDE